MAISTAFVLSEEYQTRNTPFLMNVRREGVTRINGAGVLLGQAKENLNAALAASLEAKGVGDDT